MKGRNNYVNSKAMWIELKLKLKYYLSSKYIQKLLNAEEIDKLFEFSN